MTFIVVEGNSEASTENNLIGSLIFDNIPACPRGKQNIRVELDVNINGVVTIHASHSD